MSNSTDLLKGKKIIVIGGSSGVGRSVAAAALAHGAHVVIASSSEERVNAAVEILKEGALATSNIVITSQTIDLQDFESLKVFLTSEGPFDHLVITAGNMPRNTNFPKQELEVNDQIKGMFDIQYWATMIAAQHIFKNNLINPGGSITQTVGTSAHRPPPGWGIVSGLMGAVGSSTRGLAIDLKPIRVNTMCLGAVDTEAHDSLPQGVKTQMFEALKQSLLVGHVGTPDEVAEAYLGIMKCTYITGQVLVVDGGMLLT